MIRVRDVPVMDRHVPHSDATAGLAIWAIPVVTTRRTWSLPGTHNPPAQATPASASTAWMRSFAVLPSRTSITRRRSRVRSRRTAAVDIAITSFPYRAGTSAHLHADEPGILAISVNH